MAKIETSDSKARGHKRQRPDTQGSDTPAPPENSRKRPRLESPKSIYDKFKNICYDFWGYLVGHPREMDPSNDSSTAEDTLDEDISILSETLNKSGRHMETIEASEPSLLDMVSGTDKDEVQLVKVVNSTKSFCSAATNPRSTGNTSLARFYSGNYNIATREKRDKERQNRTPSNVSSLIKKGSAPPKSSLTTFPPLPSWKKMTNDKTVFKQRRSSPGRGQAIYESYKLDDLAKYRNAYEKVLLCPEPMIARLTNSINRGSTPKRGLNDVAMSPFFPKKTISSAYASGAISKVQLSEAKTRALSEKIRSRGGQQQAPLILLDHDDDRDVVALKPRPRSSASDADVIEILDSYSPQSKSPEQKSTPKKVQNSFESDLSVQNVYKETFLDELLDKYDVRMKNSAQLLREEKVRVEHCKEISQRLQSSVEERLKKHLTITEVNIEEPEPEEEEVISLPEMTQEMDDVIKHAMSSRGQVLIDAYSIPITRKDLETLRGLNWLNDEVINFYMQMIVHRSQNHDNWPKVYATNTFFYPKLLQSGFGALKRWTRKVDVFAHDLILIPVHLGMHWCLAVVNLKKKGIYYYDSMAGNNDRCLQAIEKYLQDEHIDKKKTELDTSGFEKVNVKNIPKQMNGSDCGMFACKFAEYLSRNAQISFTQDDMPYFRKRMIYEIVKNNILHP